MNLLSRECADQPPPFGMESGAIQNSQITSSSFASGYPPYSARLNNYYGAWCSSSLSTGEWLQIDLGNDKELLAIATEGFFSSYVTSYYLMYSFDKTKWYCFGYEGVAKGH
ncbi:Lactadherin [Exaiptasia diaphana]|nr:Lactadherin [Exaiptasia diaphana]